MSSLFTKKQEEMKTPMQEFIEQLNNVKPQDFCSIETIKGWAESLLEKEKEVMCQFTLKFTSPEGPSYINSYGSIVSEEPIEEWYDKQFNTKEK